MATRYEAWKITGTNARSRRGRTAMVLASTNAREFLVYGAYQPDATNTGILPGSTLTDWNGSTTNNVNWTASGIYSNLTIYGDVKFLNTDDVVFNNCRFVGGTHTPGSASGVIDCNAVRTGTGRAKFYDCEIIPRTPSLNRDCVVGHRFSLYRCKLQKGVDGIGIFKNVPNTASDVEVQGCWVSNLTYWYPDYKDGVSGATWHTDGTHNDCVQIQGGTNIHIQGNFFDGTSTLGSGSGTNPDKPWLLAGTTLDQRWNNGAGIIIQNNVSSPTDNTVILEDNWLNGALSHLNIKPNMVFVARNNHHYRNTADNISPRWSGYWIRFDDHSSTVTGLTTNTWVDGPYAGSVLIEPRDSGIQYDA